MRLKLAMTMLAMAIGFATIASSEEIASGLAVGKHPEPLQVRDCTGPAAGKTLCYTCRYAERPTVAIFVRRTSQSVGRLVKRFDEQVGEQRDARLAAYAVFIEGDTEDFEASLKLLAKEQDLRHVPLTILRDRARKLASSYGISTEAAVTVIHWRDGTVAASRGFTASELTDADIARVLADTAKILP